MLCKRLDRDGALRKGTGGLATSARGGLGRHCLSIAPLGNRISSRRRICVLCPRWREACPKGARGGGACTRTRGGARACRFWISF